MTCLRINHRHRGFTLIELVSVLCIIGLLALIAAPTYQRTILTSKRAQARAALMQAMQQQERFYSQNNRYHAFTGIPDAQHFTWFSGDTAASSAYQINAAACAADSIDHCVVVTAVPGGPLVDPHFHDAQCGALTISSLGEKTAAGRSAAAMPPHCW